MASNLDFLPKTLKPVDDVFNFRSKLIVIQVDNPPVRFEAYENLLTRSSGYFKAGLAEPWVESQQRTVIIEDVDEDCFNIYLAWLSCGRVFATNRKSEAADNDTAENETVDNEPSDEHVTHTVLVACYLLGDRLLDADFKDAITDAMLEQLYKDNNGYSSKPEKHYPSASSAYILYDNTTESARARQLYADVFAASRSPGLPGECDHPAFLRDVAMAAIGGVPYVISNAQDCKYHEHGKGKDACYRKRLL